MSKKYLVPGLIVSLLAAVLPPAHAQDVRKAEAVAPSAPVQVGGVGVALRNGDTVDIRIANVPPEDIQQFDGAYTLDEAGMINLPYIGMVKAGGLPPSQVQTLIQNQLISAGIYTMPTVSVAPPAASRFISVGGAVKGPGRLAYMSDLTLMTAISAVGGTSDFAGDKIRLVRGGKVQFFSRHRLDKDPSKDPLIEPGDQIEVLQSWW
jgi:protein involved in polysaccharide export with SLBB domain